MADTVSCLADPGVDDKPVFGTPPESAGTEVPATMPDDSTPQISRTLSGNFTLGNGQGAPGLPVPVTAMDAGTEQADGSRKQAVLGTATTAADGSWTETLPAEVQAAVDDNGGALNASATVEGKTSSGVPVVGVDTLVTAPDDPDTGRPTAFVAAAADTTGHTQTSPWLRAAQRLRLARAATRWAARADGLGPRWRSAWCPACE